MLLQLSSHGYAQPRVESSFGFGAPDLTELQGLVRVRENDKAEPGVIRAFHGTSAKLVNVIVRSP